MILKAGFPFSVSFLSPFFFFFTKMTRVVPQLQTCFQFIYLFIYLCIFIHLPQRRRRRPRRRCHTHRLRLEKTLRLGRNCLLRSRYIGCEAPSFLPGVLHRHSQFNTSKVKVIETFEAHLTLATPARNRSCRHFSFHCTPYVNVKLSGTQDYVSTLRIVDT